MSPISLTALRSQLFKIVDRVIETGMPVEIERKGHKLKIVLEEKKSKFDNLAKSRFKDWMPAFAGMTSMVFL